MARRRLQGSPSAGDVSSAGLIAPADPKAAQRPSLSIVDCLEANSIFGPWFPGETWGAWKAILRAAFALPMSVEERAIFAELAGGRDPPLKRMKEIVIIAGRRSGKDSIASAVAAWAAGIEQGHLGLLRPGEMATVMLLARDREQARIIRNYVASYFATIPELAAMVVRETQTGLELANDVEIVIVTNDYRTIRGRTVLCAILDEAAFYADENSASPDIETDRALDPAMATLPSSLKFIISSPHKKDGLLFGKFRTSYGKNDDRTLVIKAPTTALNPTIDTAIIERAMADDPASASAEWFAQFRDDISNLLSIELLEGAVDRGVTVRPPREGIEYKGYADVASGLGRDSFAAAVAHLDGIEVVIDAIYEARPPFNPQNITEDVCALFRQYGISTCVGDKYAAGYNVEAFARCGATYQYCERDTSQNYLETVPLFASGRIRLLDSPRLVAQFAGLERRTSRTGRDRVDHGVGDRHDDLSAACAGALTLAATDLRAALVRQSDLLMDGLPLPVPTSRIPRLAAVFATDKGIGATVYAALHRQGMQPELFILDFDCGPVRGGVFAGIAARMQVLVQECNAMDGVIFVPGELQTQAEAQGLPCLPIPADFDVETRLVGVGQHMSTGSVKVCVPAHEKSKSSPFGSALEIKAGQAVDHPLTAALITTVSLSLDSIGGRVAP